MELESCQRNENSTFLQPSNAYEYAQTKQPSQQSSDLQLVLMVAVSVRQIPEFLRQLETVREILRGHKVFSCFDAWVEVPNLYSRPDIRCVSLNISCVIYMSCPHNILHICTNLSKFKALFVISRSLKFVNFSQTQSLLNYAKVARKDCNLALSHVKRLRT